MPKYLSNNYLVHSNLFDACMNRNGKLTDLTLNEMAARNHKKPFICSIIDGIYAIICIYMLCDVYSCFPMYCNVFLCI